MLPLTGYFDGLFDRIKPPEGRRELAKTLPQTVRDHLVKSDRLETMDTGTITRLAGSYGRKTGVDDIKDVDIVVFVARRYAQEDPAVVLDDLAAALKDLDVDGYGKGEVKTRRKNRRSHHVEFAKDGEESFHIDCVPVVRPDADPSAILRIPDRLWERWDDTQPIGYGDKLIALNQSKDEKVLPTIRMFKRIRNHHLGKGRPKSYWLESKVYELWQTGRLSKDEGWADLMFNLLRAVRADCRLHADRLRIYDPCLGRDLTESWERAEYGRFVAMLDKVLGWLEAISDEADPDKAIGAWKKVFGAEVFEPTDEVKQREASARAVARAPAVTKAGTVVQVATGTGTASPAHRFYGER